MVFQHDELTAWATMTAREFVKFDYRYSVVNQVEDEILNAVEFQDESFAMSKEAVY
jgi:hypothetical protein